MIFMKGNIESVIKLVVMILLFDRLSGIQGLVRNFDPIQGMTQKFLALEKSSTFNDRNPMTNQINADYFKKELTANYNKSFQNCPKFTENLLIRRNKKIRFSGRDLYRNEALVINSFSLTLCPSKTVAKFQGDIQINNKQVITYHTLTESYINSDKSITLNFVNEVTNDLSDPTNNLYHYAVIGHLEVTQSSMCMVFDSRNLC